MDLSTQYQQEQLQQTQDPSQVQAYDQTTQAYYEFHQFNQYIQQQQYPYYAQNYTNPHYQHQIQQPIQEPTSIYPPGVPITLEQTNLQNYPHGFGQNHAQDPYNSYYPQQQQLISGEFGPQPPIGQTTYTGGGGGRGGRPFRGGGSGHFGSRPNGSGPPFRGKGRGRGRGRPFPTPGDHPPASVQGESTQAPVWPPQHMAWCELCRVDCNTLAILEQHKNGKKHKKNLQVFEDLQKLNSLLVGRQNEQKEKIEGSKIKPPPSGENEQEKVSGEAELSEELAEKPGKDHFEGRGRGLKRKMRGGRGSKLMRTYEGSRRPSEPPKPKQVIPFVCELCNVKCESQVVFDSHLAGKKHLSNLKRFQGEQAMLGQAALQALYPALQALFPALQALYPPDPNASTSFGPQFHQEGGHGSQGLFPQVMVPPGQETEPGLGPISGSVQPSGSENQNHQDPKPEAELADSTKTKSENATTDSLADTPTGAE